MLGVVFFFREKSRNVTSEEVTDLNSYRLSKFVQICVLLIFSARRTLIFQSFDKTFVVYSNIVLRLKNFSC